MIQRVITGIVLVLLTALLLWIPPLYLCLALFIAVLTMIAGWEYFQITNPVNQNVLSLTSLILIPIIVFSGVGGTPFYIHLFFVLSFGVISLLYIFNQTVSHTKLVYACFALFYLGWVPAHLLLLHTQPRGPGYITMFIVAVALCDSGAFCVGKLVGKHQLAPEISPKKTWEGSIGGVVFSVIGMLVLWLLQRFVFVNFLPDQSVVFYLKWGIILSIISQFGDLLESRWKRETGVKDSGTIFPGHGGVLDRCDGMLFAFPFFFYLYKIL
ncbi:MAG TPA: phosphatidate cytidylyltransferase [Candidatus Hydrogenedens sp.]|nr:phosphatidate cytidylyltransferase [Candidatus Hydrogenedens sp.]HOK09827.1 phosphatidate cytidylyltransferase [Candidatus Hydrogenedens sp.]HOL19484.1 phosphatidate cytidylyltransferase [Candidatus Hydrogenedens sp.]HPP59412.1 phosphatidate cytidylyltransferase [Candidatus Hydrogenedens sp.]